MAVSGDVTFTQDGAHGNVKLHPYLVALVRWCVECLWNSATVVLHRLLTPLPLPPAAAKSKPKRPASKDHLDPEPRVECQVLHQPRVHGLDVIFVHGLYGSLSNTWRQGEWASKYQRPETVHLSRPTSLLRPCDCPECSKNSETTCSIAERNIENVQDVKENGEDRRNIVEEAINIDHDKINKYNDSNKLENYENIDEGDSITNIDAKFYKDIDTFIPEDEIFFTERFYDETLMDQIEIVDNYETQAKFVSDLFKKSCDSNCDGMSVNIFNNQDNINYTNDNIKVNMYHNDKNEFYNDSGDNHKTNENAILIDKNKNDVENEFTNDNNKYNDDKNKLNDNINELICNKSTHVSGIACECRNNKEDKCETGCGCNCDECYSSCWPRDWIKEDFPEARVISISYTSDPHLWRPLWIKENKRLRLHERAEQMAQQLLQLGVGERPVVWVGHSKGGLFIKQIYCEAYEAYLKASQQSPEEEITTEHDELKNNDDIQDANIKYHVDGNKDHSPSYEVRNHACDSDGEDQSTVVIRNQLKNDDNDLDKGTQASRTSQHSEGGASLRSLWSNSVGFMFYSVPHRGAPLADIKTPITARSVELLEISKDCSLVLSLQERWLRAASASVRQPLVRSLVETRRTLMSVLWLRIVSAQSADPGIGPLCGVSVDHREICKPSSRRCLLYTELAALIRTAISNESLASTKQTT